MRTALTLLGLWVFCSFMAGMFWDWTAHNAWMRIDERYLGLSFCAFWGAAATFILCSWSIMPKNKQSGGQGL